MPEPAHSSSKPQGFVHRLRLERPLECGPQIVMVQLHAFGPYQLLRTMKLGFGTFGHPQEPVPMTLVSNLGFPCLNEPVPGVVPNRLQKPVARFASAAVYKGDSSPDDPGQKIHHI